MNRWKDCRNGTNWNPRWQKSCGYGRRRNPVQAVAQQALPLGFLGGSFCRTRSPHAGRVGTGHAITSYYIDCEEGDGKNNKQAKPQGARTRASKRISRPPHLGSVASSGRLYNTASASVVKRMSST